VKWDWTWVPIPRTSHVFGRVNGDKLFSGDPSRRESLESVCEGHM